LEAVRIVCCILIVYGATEKSGKAKPLESKDERLEGTIRVRDKLNALTLFLKEKERIFRLSANLR
jgi:hypothetical protein